MKILDLINLLEYEKNVSGNLDIVLAKDEEGNVFNVLADYDVVQDEALEIGQDPTQYYLVLWP